MKTFLRALLGVALVAGVTALPGSSSADPTNGAGPGIYGEGKRAASPDSATGAMRYDFAFHLPVARGTVQPSLGLSYSSSAHDREAGYGWGLNLPTIERRPASGWPRFEQNGVPIGDERYTFDGQPLSLVCPDAANCPGELHPAWATGGWRYYRLQNDDLQARFYLYAQGNRATWRIQLKGGEHLELGSPGSGSPDLPTACDAIDRDPLNPQGIVRWRVVRRYDPSHPATSAVAYCWKKLGERGLSFLTDIWDTPRVGDPTNLAAFAHHTQLDWEAHDFPSASYAFVDRATPDQRLRRVNVASMTWMANGEREIVRSYELAYLAQRASTGAYNPSTETPFWHHSFLRMVTRRGACGSESNGAAPTTPTCTASSPPVRFEYAGTPIIASGVQTTFNGVPPQLAQPLPWVLSVSIVDFNHDGLPDLVQSWQHTGPCQCPDEPGYFKVRVSAPEGQEPTLRCYASAAHPECNLRSARPILGYVNAGGGVPSFQYTCMEATSRIITENKERTPGFLAAGGNNVLGRYSESDLLFRFPRPVSENGSPATPIIARRITDAPNAPPPPAYGGCDLGNNFSQANFYPRWRWEPGPSFDWARPAETNAEPDKPRIYADVDGDGYPDEIGQSGEDISTDLQRTSVDYTRMYSHFERPNTPNTPNTPDTPNGAQLVPFAESSGPVSSWETVAPKPPPPPNEPQSEFAPHFFYSDVNGDGLVDLIVHHPVQSSPQLPSQTQVVRIYPGNGRGRFACDASKQPSWACETGVTTAPGLQPYAVTIGAPLPPFGDNVFFHDVTGDGLADIVVFQEDWPTNNVRLWINRDGRSFECAGGNPQCSVGTIVGAQNLPHRISFADMNADGMDDLVLITPGTVWVASFSHLLAGVGPARGTKPGQLVKIHNGVGATTEIHYETVQALDLASQAEVETNWQYHSPSAQSVVTEVRVRDTKAATTPNAVEAAPYAIDRVTSYYYRDPAYDRWKRSLVGFRKIAVREGNELAVTETTRWYGPCENGNDKSVVRGEYSPVGSRCPEGSDDDPGNHESWKVGKIVGIDRYIPKWLAGAESMAGRYEWAKRFHYVGGPRFNPNGIDRSVVHGNVTKTTTTYYDANLPASLPPRESPPPEADAPELPLPTQAGSKTVTRSFEYKANDNLVLEAYCGVEGEVVDATETGESLPARALVTTYFNAPLDLTCDENWRCNAEDIHVRRLHQPIATCESINTSSFGQNVSTLRHSRLTFDSNKEVVKVEAELTTSHSLDRRHSGPHSNGVPGMAQAAWKTQSEIVRDPATGLPTKLWGPGSATSSERSCTSIGYDPAYGHLPAQVSHHLLGCDQAIGAQTTTFVFDRGLEVITENQAPNGRMSSFGIDGFGRTTAIWQPRSDYPGQSQTAQIIYKDQAPLSAIDVRTYTEHGGLGALRTVQILNGLGEPVLDFSPGDQGDWVVSGFATRLPNGAISDATRAWGGVTADPIAVATNATPVTSGLPTADLNWFYDFFGRLQELHENGVAIAKHTYLPLTVRSQDAEQSKSGGPHSGNYTEVRFDGRGQARLSLLNASAAGEPTASTRVDRDGAGLPVRVTRCAGDCDAPGATAAYERKLEYDSLGRLTKNIEPNTSKYVDGTLRYWRYAFDDANRMVGTSDARGCGVDFYYDGLGRVKGEDYSPCLDTHPVWLPPNPGTGENLEVWNRYDGYETGQVQPDLTFDDDPSFAIGNLTVVKDRGSHTRFSYDALGRTRRIDRRVVKPSGFVPQMGDGYAAHFFSKRTDYDLLDRLRRTTTGADGDLLNANGDSEEIHSYSARGFLHNINSTYGEIIASTTYAVDGQVDKVTYGDIAATEASLYYDTRRRLEHYTIARAPAPGAGWAQIHAGYSAPNAETTQSGLAQVHLALDDVGNPTQIKDLSSGTQWPGGAKPKWQEDFAYDAHYRLAFVNTQYADGPDMQVHPFDADIRAGDTRPAPLADTPLRPAQRFHQYDVLGNTILTTDDAGLRFDRSLGNITHGGTEGPNQLRTAEGVTARYDEAGNLVDLKVSRQGTCFTAGPSKCYQWYHYDWDEVGQLARARRWDYETALPELQEPDYPADTPAWDLHFAYSLGVRILKSAQEAAGAETHTVEIFDSLRLQQVPFRTSTEEYRREGAYSHAYVGGGVGHVFYDREGSLPHANASSFVHTFLTFGDHLGSTAFVIDKDSSELVERAQHHPYGAIESDYRPTRWSSPREDYKFTGKEEDIEVGLTYFGARYYHARLGRWASADPLTIHGLGADLNPYAYVSGRVAAAVDPFGLCVTDGPGENEVTVTASPCGRADQRADGITQWDQPQGQFTVPSQPLPPVTKDTFDPAPKPRAPQVTGRRPADPKQYLPGVWNGLIDLYNDHSYDVMGHFGFRHLLNNLRLPESGNSAYEYGGGAVDFGAAVIPLLGPGAVRGGTAGGKWLAVHNRYLNFVRPGARGTSLSPSWASGRLGTRILDDFAVIGGKRVGFEANTTPWLRMTQDKYTFKMAQAAADFTLMSEGQLDRVIWFGTEPLPTTGLGGQLGRALEAAGIEYWWIPQ